MTYGVGSITRLLSARTRVQKLLPSRDREGAVAIILSFPAICLMPAWIDCTRARLRPVLQNRDRKGAAIHLLGAQLTGAINSEPEPRPFGSGQEPTNALAGKEAAHRPSRTARNEPRLKRQ